MKKKLIVLRHAHRDVYDREADNGLSPKGKKQAVAIQEHFKETFGREEIPSLYSSPRLRCQETLQPLAEYLKTKIQINPILDEAAHSEVGSLGKRIQQFKKWWIDEAPKFSVICSHGDWIPVFFEVIGESCELKKAGWAEVKLNENKISLKDVIQKWDIES